MKINENRWKTSKINDINGNQIWIEGPDEGEGDGIWQAGDTWFDSDGDWHCT